MSISDVGSSATHVKTRTSVSATTLATFPNSVAPKSQPDQETPLHTLWKRVVKAALKLFKHPPKTDVPVYNNPHVAVSISLSPGYRFSAIYPPINASNNEAGNQRICWDVRTDPNGTLTHINTGLELSSLFWEAEADMLRTRESSLYDLNDANSVVLPTVGLTVYLERVLSELGVHVEARTSFITFWLPSFLRHDHIAFRFILREEYAEMAKLEVIPKPDAIVRIFMVFKGVDNVESWTASLARAQEDVSFWIDVIGVDKKLFQNKDLFRVLEWGGMEVPLSA